LSEACFDFDQVVEGDDLEHSALHEFHLDGVQLVVVADWRHFSNDIEPAEIGVEVRAGLRSGHLEPTLLADDCGSYGADIGCDLGELLHTLLAIDERLRLKISTLFPGDFLRLWQSLRDVIRSGRISYLNLPLQSGSQRVLDLMGRSYQVREVLDKLRQVRRISPRTWLYTHLMIGFPSETEADFECSLAAAAAFDEAMFITYSDNPGTAAAAIVPKVPARVVEARAGQARELLRGRLRGLFVDASYREIGGDQPGQESRQMPVQRGPAEPQRVVQLTLTNRCQCSCSHCGVKHVNRVLGKQELSLEQIGRVLRDIKTAGFASVDLFGGEPTLRSDLVEIVRMGVSLGLDMLIETNAIALDDALLLPRPLPGWQF
jgi:tRNA A37 methylthiotransferase MiaB